MTNELAAAPNRKDARLPARWARHAPELRLSLLGSWSLSLDDDLLSVPESAQRVIALVALKGRQRRTYIAGMLWPDVRDEQALTRLRTTLWRIRRIAPGLLAANEHNVELGCGVHLDVSELLFVGRRIVEAGLDGIAARSFESVIGAPELLLGWYEDWVISERERLCQLRVHALEHLVDDLVRAGRYSEALEAAHAAVGLDPLRESTHRAVIRVYLAEGNPASARRQFDRYRQLLRTELGSVQPTPLMLEMLGPLAQGPALPQLGLRPRG